MRETELPGVGTKYTLQLPTGEAVVAVEHRLGHWEIAHADASGNTKVLLKLEAKQAAELGRLLAHQSTPVVDERKQMLFDAFCLEWVTLAPGSPLVGQTLADSGIRPRTGASVIAVLRRDESIPNPQPDQGFEAGDTLVLSGQREQIERFLETYPNPQAGEAGGAGD